MEMNTERKRILFADDDPEIREVVRILLEHEGFEVIEASNGKEAVEKSGGSVDLIILDVMMPGKSGILACLEIRKKLTVPAPRILIRRWDFAQGEMITWQNHFPIRSWLRESRQCCADITSIREAETGKKMTHRYKSGICFLIRTAVRCVWREEKFFLRIWNTGFSFFSRRTGGRFLRYRISMRAFGKNHIITFPITR